MNTESQVATSGCNSQIARPIERIEINDFVKNHKLIWDKDITEFFEKLFRQGEILTDWKERIGRGHWLKWIEENLPISHTMVDRYLSIYENRETILKEFKATGKTELPSMRFVSRIASKIKKNKRTSKAKPRERCPTCGQLLSKLAKSYMKKKVTI